MNDNKREAFLRDMSEVLGELNDKWFPPDKKTPDGNHYYACSHCDLNCSMHDKHDDTCLYQMAKNTLEKWKEIENDTKWDLDWKGKPRDPEEIVSFRKHYKYYAVFSHFIKNVSAFVPLDYTDPGNQNVVCQCSMFNAKFDRHAKNCIEVRVAKILRNLLKPTGSRPKIPEEVCQVPFDSDEF